MNCYWAALLVALLGFVGSAPLSEKRNIMNYSTVEHADGLISKILIEIPKAHASWITLPNLKLGSSVNLELQHLKENLIPSAPVLESISENFTLEICLDRIFKGLRLHENLLKVISQSNKLPQAGEVVELPADIRDLLSLINQLQTEAGFELSTQAIEHDLAKQLKSEYMTQVATHLTLQQLQVFSYDVLRTILTFYDMASSRPSSED